MSRLVQIAEAAWVDAGEIVAVTVTHEPKARLATLAVGLRADVLGLTWQLPLAEAQSQAARIVALVNERDVPAALMRRWMTVGTDRKDGWA